MSKLFRFITIIFIMLIVICLPGCQQSLPQPSENQLATPTNLNVTSGVEAVVTWDNVDGAVDYVLYLYRGGNCIQVIDGVNSGYTLSNLDADNYEVSIMAVGDQTNKTNSFLSNKVNFVIESSSSTIIKKLAEPTKVEVKYDKDNHKIQVTFANDESYTLATNFRVYFYKNDQLVTSEYIEESGLYVNVTTFEKGLYTVKVQAIGNNSSATSSTISTSFANFTIEEEVNVEIILTGYYKNANGLIENELLIALRKIITDTHKNKLSYDGLKTALPESDVDPNNSDNLILFYSQVSVKKTWDSGNTWNREHVWPNSLGTGKSGPGSDAHHLRPSDPIVNSTRGNKKIDNVTGGTEIIYRPTNKPTGCFYSGNTFEPADCIKGDVARIYFYLLTRYESLQQTLNQAANFNTLLKWHIEDPVSDFEISRNEAIFSIQGNRNPFIDHPELVQMIWG